ncbi:hypothetical protein PG997_003392 [Apiospora hydei]|uniref:Uncharacterized protein n=1 Tax=Apiospora hydei TaxID=1337664 RepID=A0ABR1WZ41_9PEZI
MDHGFVRLDAVMRAYVDLHKSHAVRARAFRLASALVSELAVRGVVGSGLVRLEVQDAPPSSPESSPATSSGSSSAYSSASSSAYSSVYFHLAQATVLVRQIVGLGDGGGGVVLGAGLRIISPTLRERDQPGLLAALVAAILTLGARKGLAAW